MSGTTSKKRLWIFFIVIIVSALVLFLLKETNIIAYYPDQSVWDNRLHLTFKDREYTVTNQKTNDIGEEIGGVTYHGTYPSSFHLYSIKYVSDFSKIAIKTRHGYFIAIINK